VPCVAKIPIFPHGSTPALSPAYPSGHGCQSRYVALILSHFFPDQQDFLIQLSDYVAHYKSFIKDDICDKTILELNNINNNLWRCFLRYHYWRRREWRWSVRDIGCCERKAT
jgi:hypothetical protein